MSRTPNDPNAADAAIVARYEYDPYGNVTAASGPYATANPFRWSTKYWDDETGFGYWGRRYYDAALGRWLSRDPLDELGGVNLYAYAGNDPADRFESYAGLRREEASGSRTRTSNSNGTARDVRPGIPTETRQSSGQPVLAPASGPVSPDSAGGCSSC